MGQRMMFVNLPVRDPGASRRFFRALGFSFDPRFTDARAACMVVSDAAAVMLIEDRFYRTFTTRELCDTSRQEEGLVAVSCERREEVDVLVGAAAAAGGAPAMPPVDRGFMYERSFYDPDGHHWAVVWMDPDVDPHRLNRPGSRPWRRSLS
jgi:predicted lactoylglutathione lyase